MSKEGIGTIAGLSIFTVFIFILGFRLEHTGLIVLAIILFILTAFSLYFFRDPQRLPPTNPDAIVAPADGKIIEIVEKDEPEYLEGKAKRISIFLSLFDIHVNYIPYSGNIDYLRYAKGKFHKAFLDKASELNEHTIIGLETPHGKLVFKQIAGILARRIICRLKMDETVITGQKFGIIKFGSRAEVYIPEWAEITVTLGERVRAGETTIAKVIKRK